MPELVEAILRLVVAGLVISGLILSDELAGRFLWPPRR